MRHHSAPPARGRLEVLIAEAGGRGTGQRRPPAAPPGGRCQCAGAARGGGAARRGRCAPGPALLAWRQRERSSSIMGDTLEEPWWETPTGAGSGPGTPLLELPPPHAGLETVSPRASSLLPGPPPSFSFFIFIFFPLPPLSLLPAPLPRLSPLCF